MSLTLITPAITDPVTIEDARRQCRVHASDTTYDAELQGYLDAAVSHIEESLSIVLEPQTWRLTLDGFDGNIALPLGPVIEVDSISYDAGDVTFTVIDAADYSLRALPDARWEVVPIAAWPNAVSGMDKVIVDFTVGYEGELDSATYTSGVPADLKQAILLLVGHWFRNRQAVEIVSSGDLVSVPLAFDALVLPYRRAILA